MKRIFAILLVFVLIFSLSSCASKPVESEPTDDVQDENVEDIIEEIPETIEINAGVFWYDFADAYLSTVRTALDAELEAAGVNFTNYDAAKSQIEQISQIDEAIKNGSNLLIVNIVDTASIDMAQSIVNIAKSVDIPIIFFNREVDDSVINSYENACFVGTRAAEAREMQGIMVGEYIVANYDAVDLNNDGNISYIFMKGELGSAELPPEHNTENIISCNAILTGAGKPELIYYDLNNTDRFEPSNWSKTEAFNLMETALGTNPMDGDNAIEVVFANNDDAALGCVEALNAKGWNTGDDQFIPVFGVDYTADAAAAIDAGKMTGTIRQSATGMAETIAALAANVVAGEAVFANTDAFNVDDTAAKIRVPYEIMA